MDTPPKTKECWVQIQQKAHAKIPEGKLILTTREGQDAEPRGAT